MVERTRKVPCLTIEGARFYSVETIGEATKIEASSISEGSGASSPDQE